TGFFVIPQTRSATVNGRGNLIVPFSAPNQGFPLGFEGNNGLWLNADQVRTFYVNQVGNAELNYRAWNGGLNQIELILGTRYFHSSEQVGIYTNDELFTLNALGNADPRRAATYTATSRNNLVALQAGGEYGFPIPLHPFSRFFWLTTMAK